MNPCRRGHVGDSPGGAQGSGDSTARSRRAGYCLNEPPRMFASLGFATSGPPGTIHYHSTEPSLLCLEPASSQFAVVVGTRHAVPRIYDRWGTPALWLSLPCSTSCLGP